MKTTEKVEDAAVAILLVLKPLSKRARSDALDLACKATAELDAPLGSEDRASL